MMLSENEEWRELMHEWVPSREEYTQDDLRTLIAKSKELLGDAWAKSEVLVDDPSSPAHRDSYRVGLLNVVFRYARDEFPEEAADMVKELLENDAFLRHQDEYYICRALMGYPRAWAFDVPDNGGTRDCMSSRNTNEALHAMWRVVTKEIETSGRNLVIMDCDPVQWLLAAGKSPDVRDLQAAMRMLDVVVISQDLPHDVHDRRMFPDRDKLLNNVFESHAQHGNDEPLEYLLTDHGHACMRGLWVYWRGPYHLCRSRKALETAWKMRDMYGGERDAAGEEAPYNPLVIFDTLSRVLHNDRAFHKQKRHIEEMVQFLVEQCPGDRPAHEILLGQMFGRASHHWELNMMRLVWNMGQESLKHVSSSTSTPSYPVWDNIWEYDAPKNLEDVLQKMMLRISELHSRDDPFEPDDVEEMDACVSTLLQDVESLYYPGQLRGSPTANRQLLMTLVSCGAHMSFGVLVNFVDVGMDTWMDVMKTACRRNKMEHCLVLRKHLDTFISKFACMNDAYKEAMWPLMKECLTHQNAEAVRLVLEQDMQLRHQHPEAFGDSDADTEDERSIKHTRFLYRKKLLHVALGRGRCCDHGASWGERCHIVSMLLQHVRHVHGRKAVRKILGHREHGRTALHVHIERECNLMMVQEFIRWGGTDVLHHRVAMAFRMAKKKEDRKKDLDALRERDIVIRTLARTRFGVLLDELHEYGELPDYEYGWIKRKYDESLRVREARQFLTRWMMRQVPTVHAIVWHPTSRLAKKHIGEAQTRFNAQQSAEPSGPVMVGGKRAHSDVDTAVSSSEDDRTTKRRFRRGVRNV